MNDVQEFLEWVRHGHGVFKRLWAGAYKAGVAIAVRQSPSLALAGRSGPRDTAIVVDVSGSMESRDYPPTRLDGGILAAAEYVEARAEQCPGDRVAVISFNDAAQVVLPLTSITKKETIIRAIRRLSAGGGTDIAKGLRAAAGIFGGQQPSNRQRHVILLTDGQGGNPIRIAGRSKRGYGVVIDVVGIGGSPSEVNESLLRKVATTDPDGFCHYRYIRDPETLSEHYRQLAKSIVWRGGDLRKVKQWDF